MPAVLGKLIGVNAAMEEQAVWEAEGEGSAAALATERDVLIEVDGAQSKAAIHAEVRETLVGSSLGRQLYLERKCTGLPAPLHHQAKWISKQELVDKRGRFTREGADDYCPVHWKLHDELVVCPKNKALKFVVDIGDELLVACGEECKWDLSSNPKYYMDAKPLPDDLPALLSREEAAVVPEDQLECKGYCPVTFFDGPEKQENGALLPIQTALRKPEKDEEQDHHQQHIRVWVVAYAGAKYRMLDEAKTDRFMRTPWKFRGLQLPVKLPFEKEKVDINALPLVGYLEQTVVDGVTDGLLSVGKACPRFPGIGNKESALKYLALYLRATNPKNSPVASRLYAEAFDRYRQACELLTRGCSGPTLPAALPLGHELVEQFVQAKQVGPQEYVKG